MAKSVKLEDYWKQNNIEGIFKDLTHMLVQKMSPDPVLAIVQFLQKKYPKSFKNLPDHNDSMTSFSKTAANNLQSQSMLSSKSEFEAANRSYMDLGRRASVQSQVSGIATIPSMGSAFTGLLKFDRSDSQAQPALVLKNLALIDRISQHAVRMGKDLRSESDIIDEELIQPTRAREETHPTHDRMVPIDLENPDLPPTHDQPTTSQLIKYKQNIRTQFNRRAHRKQLADIAQQKRAEEDFIHVSAQSENSDEVAKRMRRSRDQHRHHEAHPETENGKDEQPKIVALGAEEQEILNEELRFDSGLPRERERGKRKTSLSRSHSPNVYAQDLMNTSRSLPMMQFFVCKVCGNVMKNGEKIESNVDPLQDTVKHPQDSVAASEAIVDDWFESSSSAGDPPRSPSVQFEDPITPSPSDSISLPQNVFQPIADRRNPINIGRPPMISLVVTDDEPRSRNRTPRLSGSSDVFVRTPEPIAIRRSSSRGIMSPVGDNSRSSSRNLATSSPPVKDAFSPVFSQKRTDSPLINTASRETPTRRMSRADVNEHPYDLADQFTD